MVLLCVLVYFVSYIAKINYDVVILEIVQAEGLLNSCTYIEVPFQFMNSKTSEMPVGT